MLAHHSFLKAQSVQPDSKRSIDLLSCWCDAESEPDQASGQRQGRGKRKALRAFLHKLRPSLPNSQAAARGTQPAGMLLSMNVIVQLTLIQGDCMFDACFGSDQ